MDSGFGRIGKITAEDDTHYDELFMILKNINHSKYDAIAIFPNRIENLNSDNHAMVSEYFLDKGSYVIIGSIFSDASMLMVDRQLYLKEIKNYINHVW